MTQPSSPYIEVPIYDPKFPLDRDEFIESLCGNQIRLGQIVDGQVIIFQNEWGYQYVMHTKHTPDDSRKTHEFSGLLKHYPAGYSYCLYTFNDFVARKYKYFECLGSIDPKEFCDYEEMSNA